MICLLEFYFLLFSISYTIYPHNCCLISPLSFSRVRAHLCLECMCRSGWTGQNGSSGSFHSTISNFSHSFCQTWKRSVTVSTTTRKCCRPSSTTASTCLKTWSMVNMWVFFFLSAACSEVCVNYTGLWHCAARHSGKEEVSLFACVGHRWTSKDDATFLGGRLIFPSKEKGLVQISTISLFWSLMGLKYSPVPIRYQLHYWVQTKIALSLRLSVCVKEFTFLLLRATLSGWYWLKVA